MPHSKPSRRPDLTLTVSRPDLLVDGSDLQFSRLVHGLLGFLSRHGTLQQGHGAMIGLAANEYAALAAIGHLAGQDGVSARLVANHLHLSAALINTVTNKLLARGLVGKTADKLDRRRVRLTLTPSGRALLRRLAPVQRRVNDVQFEPLSAQEFRQLLGMVEQLVQSSERALSLQRHLAQDAAPA